MRSPDYDVAENLFPELLAIGDVAEAMATNLEVVEKWTAEGRIPCVHVAGDTLFLPEEVKKFVLAHQDLYGAE